MRTRTERRQTQRMIRKARWDDLQNMSQTLVRHCKTCHHRPSNCYC